MIVKITSPMTAIRVRHGKKVEDVLLEPGTYTFVEADSPLTGERYGWIKQADDLTVGMPKSCLETMPLVMEIQPH